MTGLKRLRLYLAHRWYQRRANRALADYFRFSAAATKFFSHLQHGAEWRSEQDQPAVDRGEG